MVDYGIVSLLIIQVSACIGSVVAWLRIRKEADAIIRAGSDNRAEIEALDSSVNIARGSVSAFESRLSAMESDIGKAVRAAENARDNDAVHKAEIRSLKAAMAARKRWDRDEEDGATIDPVEPSPASVLHPDYVPPAGKNGTFGVKAA